jgi:hypothetical protein
MSASHVLRFAPFMHAVGAALLALAVLPCHADEPLKLNPFNDPFVSAVHGLPACPEPRGPAYTDAEIRQEAHGRAERGTTCWLQGRCSEPNAYRYDARIAQAAVDALRGEPLLAGSSIWVVAERRFIYLQGCVADAAQASRAEALAKSVKDVEIVIPMLALPGEAPRYPCRTKDASMPTGCR